MTRSEQLVQEGLLLPEEVGVLQTLNDTTDKKHQFHGNKGKKPWNFAKPGYHNKKKTLHKVTRV